MKSIYRSQLDAALHPLFEKIPDGGRVLDVGGGQNNPYKNWVKAKTYHVLDVDPATKPHIVGDAHAIDAKKGTYDVVIATEVLEHCHSPHEAVGEIHRVLAPNGVLVGSVPFAYPYHGNGAMKDYYRFSVDGLQFLLRDFSSVEIIPFGRMSTYVLTILGNKLKYFKILNPLLERVPATKTYAGCVFLARK